MLSIPSCLVPKVSRAVNLPWSLARPSNARQGESSCNATKSSSSGFESFHLNVFGRSALLAWLRICYCAFWIINGGSRGRP
jgi:hypothetical protein